MKSWLLALGLALCCLVQANGMRFEDADHEAMAEKEYYVRAFRSNCEDMKKMVSHMKVAPVSFDVKSEDKIGMTLYIATPKGCKDLPMTMKKIDGKYVVECRRGGKKTVEEIETYGKYTFITMTASKEGKEPCTVISLLSPDLGELGPGVLEKLESIAAKSGLTREKNMILPKEGMCSRSS